MGLRTGQRAGRDLGGQIATRTRQDPVEALDEDGTVDVLTRLWAGANVLDLAAWPTARAAPPE